MLHELLISLRGHSGYIFVDNNDKICVNPTLTFLHPCEVSIVNNKQIELKYSVSNKARINIFRHLSICFLFPKVAILNDLLELGTNYRKIKNFITNNVAGSISVSEGEHDSCRGMYLESVCQGIDIVLDSYRDTLAMLEKEMLYEGDTYPLSLVQHKLSPHRHVLRYLVKLVTQLTRDQPRGVMILDTVYRATSCGVSDVAAALRRGLSEGHKVLYKQLLAWLLQGALYDPYQVGNHQFR